MRIWVFLLAAICCISCQTQLQKQLNTADTITIHYYNNSRADSVVKIVRTTSKDAIQNFTTYIENKQVQVPSACGHDGDIIFYKGTTVIQVLDFNLLELNCRHFAFDNGGKHVTLQMNK